MRAQGQQLNAPDFITLRTWYSQLRSIVISVLYWSMKCAEEEIQQKILSHQTPLTVETRNLKKYGIAVLLFGESLHVSLASVNLTTDNALGKFAEYF
jgi:hypothetical protein